jgi:hypothetical protein
MVSHVGSFLLCSCGFFQRFGLPCHHLFVVLERGPRPSNCATRWRRGYLAHYPSGKPELDRLLKESTMQEPIGPFYCQEPNPLTYPTFVCSGIRDMWYYKNPLEETLYYIQGCDEIQQSTVVSRIVPKGELPSDLHSWKRKTLVHRVF